MLFLACGSGAVCAGFGAHTAIGKGFCDHLPLLESLEQFWYPSIRALDPETAYWAVLSSYLESIKCGVTTVNDMYRQLGGLGRAAAEIGIRAVLSNDVALDEHHLDTLQDNKDAYDAVPGTAGLQHRIGGLEKADRTGNISYDPDNHDFMTRTRQAKVDGIAASIPPTDVEDPDGDARVAVIGWGSTYGPIGAACRQIRGSGRSVAQIHLRHLNPMPADPGEVLRRYDRVFCPVMNLAQLVLLLRA